MKKVIFSFVVASFLFGGLSVLAKDNSLPSAGTAPDSPFYIFKTLKENIQTFFIFGAENKAKQFLRLADVRLAEYQKMQEKGKIELAQKTLDKYEKQLNRARSKVEELKNKGKDVKDISEKIASSTAKHIEILENNLQKVPESVKEGLEKVLENAKKIKGGADETANWTGTYEYGEFASSSFGSNQVWDYKLKIYKEGEQLKAQLDIDGFQTLTRIQAIARELNGNLDIIFENYRPENIGGAYQKGNLLFSLEKTSDIQYKIIWNKLKSNLIPPLSDATFMPDYSVETADWKIYIDNEHGLEIKYPSNWYFGVNNYGTQRLVCFNPLEVEGDCTALLTIDRNISLQDKYNQSKRLFSNDNIVDESIIDFGNTEWKLLTVKDANGFSKSVFFEDNNYIYNFSVVKEKEFLFWQMLFTLQFLE